jgi:hypothetical protein
MGRPFARERCLSVQPAQHVVLGNLDAVAAGLLGRLYGRRYLNIGGARDGDRSAQADWRDPPQRSGQPGWIQVAIATSSFEVVATAI